MADNDAKIKKIKMGEKKTRQQKYIVQPKPINLFLYNDFYCFRRERTRK